MRRHPNYLHSHPTPHTKVNQPSPVFLSSHLFPLIKHSDIMHTFPHKNPISPLKPYNNLALMFFRSTSGHETSNVPDAAGTKFNVAKSHEQHVANADYCDSSTMFICLCKTLLHDGILDSEVQIPGFIIVRSDRVSRPGGGVCLYLRKNLIYKFCLKYSNSVCDLLIVKILSPDLIIILVYRPPSSPSNVAKNFQ